MHLITKEKCGFKVSFYYDEDARSPREHTNLGIMVLFHSKYSFPNESDMSRDEAIEFWNKKTPAHIPVILPVYMYEHGCVALSSNRSYPFNDRWDSSHIGFIYTTKEKIREWYNIKRVTKKYIAKVEEILQYEVTIYGKYINGDVYGYAIEKDGIVIEACNGFYDFDYMEYEAMNAIKFL